MVVTDGETGRRYDKQNVLCTVIDGKNVMSAQMSDVGSLILGVETVLRLERHAWSMVK